jgi:hypothetical protein
MLGSRRAFFKGTALAGLGLATAGIGPGLAFGQGQAKGIALGIGLNQIDPTHYGTDGKLTACEADAKDVMSIAKRANFQLFGGSGLLLTRQATRAAVRKAFQDVAGQLNPGDIFLIHYSGHGDQVPDQNGDERDGKDETWCLYDGQLIDDEIYFLFSKFKEGVRVLMLSDSCHSGTVSRTVETVAAINSNAYGQQGILRGRDIPSVPNPQQPGGANPLANDAGENRPGVFRTLADEVLANTYFKNREFYDKVAEQSEAENPRAESVPVRASVLLISGCQDNQLSQDGTFNGLFTGTLKKVWRNGTFKGTYRDFHSQIVDLMPPTQSPNFYPVGKPALSFWMQQPFTISSP